MKYINNVLTQMMLFLGFGFLINQMILKAGILAYYISNLNWYGIVCGFTGAFFLILFWWAGYIVSLLVKAVK